MTVVTKEQETAEPKEKIPQGLRERIFQVCDRLDFNKSFEDFVMENESGGDVFELLMSFVKPIIDRDRSHCFFLSPED